MKTQLSKVKIAAPLFILRDLCKNDLFTVLEGIKELGFDGVEFLGLFGNDPDAIKDKLTGLKLEALGNHAEYEDFRKDIDSVIKAHKTIGCKYITISGLPKEKLSDRSAISEYIKSVTHIGSKCRENGITLLYHNHDKELSLYDDRYYMEEILDRIPADSLSYEPDLGWIAIAGAEPSYFLDKYKDRCPVIHLKDYYAKDSKRIGDVHELGQNKGDEAHSFFEFRPTGYGVINLPLLINKIADCRPEWVVADHDLAYERDIYNDLKLSLDYIRNLFRIL